MNLLINHNQVNIIISWVATKAESNNSGVCLWLNYLKIYKEFGLNLQYI
jgi:hypothetical protein